MKKILQKIKTYTNQKKGFTLLETLIAIFILSLALTGPIYIATLAIRSSVETRDNISAYYLAEEAIEVIRNVRDTNSLNGRNWIGVAFDNNLRKCVSAGSAKNTCVMTTGSDNQYIFTPCTGSTCEPLVFTPTQTITYGAPTFDPSLDIQSKFTRSIYIDEIHINKEMIAHSIVTWQDKGRERKLEITEHLFNQDYNQYYTDN